ncbi:hypothetical protein N7520_003427, partial [Penicillium odoratum]|uniref:uncharacterized protein n=1 Tax=Penicillium odoratum TaxID=1167516 RepID=UPI00254869BC
MAQVPQNAPQNLPQAAFDRALDSFKKDLTKRDRDSFKITTFQDLQKSIDDLQKKHHSARRLQDLSRLGVFLEAIEQYTKVVDPFCNSNEIVAFVLGPVKFLLQIASSYQKAFQELVSIYEDIGKNLPLLLQYQELFRTKPHMVKVLLLIYEDILKFHRLAMRYFQRRVWKQLFDATWPSHTSRFSAIIDNLRKHQTLIDRQATIAQIEDEQAARLIEEDRFEVLMQNEDLERSRVVFNWLKSPQMDTDQYNFTKVRADYPDSGKWLLDNQSFKEWFDPSYPKIPPLLWVNGIPGSGKTILASFVVEEARKLATKPTVLFFYCKHDDPEHDNFLALARGILAQILHQDKDLLLYFYQERCNSKEAVLAVPDQVRRLLTFAFQNCKNAYIILDGLDECKRDDRKDIVQWFIKLVESLPVSESSRLRCLFTSRDDGPGRKDFENIDILTIRQQDTQGDLQRYCQFQAERLKDKLWLSPDRAQEISLIVSQRAGALFLLARLIWDSLLEAMSIQSLEQQLEPSRLPADLDDAMSLFKFALRSFANILCSFLVDEDIVNPLTHDIEMGCLCLDYLNLPIFTDSISTRATCQGNYGLMDYAVIYWIKHLEGVLAEAGRRMKTRLQEGHRVQANSEDQDRSFVYPTLREEDYAQVMFPFAESLSVFLDKHWIKPKISLEVSSRNKRKLQVFQGKDFHEQLEQIFVFTRKQLHSFSTIKKDEMSTDISDIVHEVRGEIEKAFTSADPPSKSSIIEKYGDNLFKCPRLSCRYFTSGFPTAEERDKHIRKHERPLRCNYKDCITGFEIGYVNQAQYKRHMRDLHPSPSTQVDQFPTDQEIHQSKQIILKDQAKARPVPSSSNNPQPNQNQNSPAGVPAGVSSNPQTVDSSSDSEPEIRPLPRPERTVEDLTCPTCSRVYTKLYNLRSHLRVHETNRPFSCEFCQKSFARKNDCNRHRKIHLGTRDW